MFLSPSQTATLGGGPTPISVFSGPTNAAALCLQIIRQHQPITRSFLVGTTPLSQPTITRATAKLIEANLIHERPDLVIPSGPGRPTIPLEFAPNPWVMVGIAVGTRSTFIGMFGTRGQLLREKFLHIAPKDLSTEAFAAELTPHVTAMAHSAMLPLATVGVSTSGQISDGWLVTAPNLGWDNASIAAELQAHLNVPITLASVIEAIAGAEQQNQVSILPSTEATQDRGLVFYADDSIGAAVHTTTSVETLTVETEDSYSDAVLNLTAETMPSRIVLAGSAFESRDDAHAIGQAIKASEFSSTEVRVIPTYADNARAAARAVALSSLIADPVNLAKSVASRG